MHLLLKPLQICLSPLRNKGAVRLWTSVGLIAAAIICLAVAGYCAMYQMLFLGQGLEDLAMDRAGRPLEDFKFEGVKWFHGTRLVPGEGEIASTAFELRSIRIMDVSDAVLELFIKLQGIEPGHEEQIIATLQVVHRSGGEAVHHQFELSGEGLQRFQMPWPTDRSGSTTTTLRLETHVEPAPFEAALVGTSLSVDLLGRTLAWLIPGLALLAAGILLAGRSRRTIMFLVIGTVLLLGVFRSGAFITNDYFLETSGEASIFRTAFGHMRKFERSGEWYPHVYKRLGTLAIPKLTLTIEPAAVTMPTDYYVDTYPTPRYLWFIMECAAVSIFVVSIWLYLSPAIACVYPFLHVIFPPFLFNLYNMEGDSLLVLLMLPLTALLLKVSRQRAVTAPDYAGFFLIMLLILLCKITAAFLILVIPPGLYLAQRTRGRRRALAAAAGVFAALFCGAIAGNVLNKVTPPPAGEAQPGFPFHSHPLWDILWAANGLYDRDTAHPFIKVGRSRDRVVAEAAGLPPDEAKRMRHAAVGDTLVYKPQLKRAFEERPGFFLNQALIRFWTDGLMFFGYPHRGNYWRQDVVTKGDVSSPSFELEDDGPPAAAVQAHRLGYLGRDTPILRSRFDEVWKIAPLILVTSMFNFDQPDDRVVNLVLLVLALVGIACTRRSDLIFIFFAAVAGKILFNTFVHGNIRYMDFVHVPLLLGLAALIAVAFYSFYRAGRDVCAGDLTTDDQSSSASQQPDRR